MIIVLLALITFERPVAPAGPGPNRLEADLALLARAAPDLRDLRFNDPAGREVPYLLMPAKGRESEWVSSRVLAIAATKTSSGFEADFGRSRAIDQIRVRGLRAPYLKRARIEGSGDRVRWTLLADTTLFDLPAEELLRDVAELSPGEFRYIRLTWDDRSSAPAAGSPSVSARIHRSATPAPVIAEAVPFTKRTSEPGRSRYRIDLPGPKLPITAIELRVSGADVFRDATVSEPRLTGAELVPVPLGGARLKRAERNGVVASDLVIPISSPESRELDLLIDDGSNPPLHVTSIVVRLAPLPWIYFESDGSTLVARYGSANLEAPKYDLEAARKLVMARKVGRARWLRGAEVSPVQRSTEVPPPTAGAPIDRSAFRHSRTLANAPAGLTVLRLDADVLARSRELRDVRIVDTGGRQIPYVVDARREPLLVRLTIPTRQQRERNTSVYGFALPYENLPAGTRLALTTTARVFQRTVQLRQPPDERRGAEARQLADMRWRAGDSDRAAPALVLDLPSRHGRTLEILVAEGDNAPLPIASAGLYIPSFALRFYHPGTPLSLLYGNASIASPQYDLALLTPRLFREQAREIALVGGATNDAEDEGRERRYFWVAIAVVAVGLLALLARLLAPLLREEARPLS